MCLYIKIHWSAKKNPNPTLSEICILHVFYQYSTSEMFFEGREKGMSILKAERYLVTVQCVRIGAGRQGRGEGEQNKDTNTSKYGIQHNYDTIFIFK